MATFSQFYASRSSSQVVGPASSYPPAQCFIRGTWDDAKPSFWRYADPLKGGENIPLSVTESFSQLPAYPNQRQQLFTFVSPPLKAQTISGIFDLVLGLRTTNVANVCSLRLHIWVLNGAYEVFTDEFGSQQACLPDDPLEPCVRGILLDNYEDDLANTLPTTSTGFSLAAPQALTPVDVLDGDFLMVEFGVVAQSVVAVATSRSIALRVGSVTTRPPTGTPLADLTVGSTSTSTLAGYLSFSVPIDIIDTPANDTCAAATVVAALPYLHGPVNTQMATYEAGVDTQSTCAAAQAGSTGGYSTTWFEWTADATGTLRVETKPLEVSDYWYPGTDMDDSEITVYTGGCGALVQVGCAQGYNGSGALVFVSVTNGTPYRFKLGSRAYGGHGGQVFALRMVAVPPNDDIANAILIASLPYSDEQDTSLATTEPGEVLSANGWVDENAYSVWYTWVAPADMHVRVSSMGSLIDGCYVSVWEGTTPWALTEVFSGPWTNVANDEGYWNQAEVVFAATEGSTYYFQIATEPGGAAEVDNRGGSIMTLTVSEAPNPPVNESWATALVVPSLPYWTNIDTTDAKDGQMDVVDLGGSFYDMENNDSGKAVWWKWTADRTAPIQMNTYGTGIYGPYAEVILYTGDSAPDTLHSYDGFNIALGTQCQLFVDAVEGTTYWWRITSNGRISGTVYFYLDEDFVEFQDGDLVVGCSFVYLFASTGAFRGMTGIPGVYVPTGSAINPVDVETMHQATWQNNTVTRFNAWLDPLGSYTSVPGIYPEVPGFFADARFYVGHWGDDAGWGIAGPTPADAAIRRFDPDTGALVSVHVVEQENIGAPYLDPAEDQSTIVYTSYGRKVFRYDVVDDAQLPDVGTVTGSYPTYAARGIRARPNGEFLLGDRAEVKRLADDATVLQTYDPAGDASASYNVLDQNGDSTTMWVGDQNARVWKVNIATGAIILQIGGPRLGYWYAFGGIGSLCGLSTIGAYRAGVAAAEPPTPCLDIYPLLPLCIDDIYPILPSVGSVDYPALPEEECMDASTFVCNMALAEIGISKQITDLATDTTQEAELCRLYFTEVLDIVLRDYPWKFATEYADLVWLEGTEDEWVNADWRYTYTLPTDCVRVRRVCDPALQRKYTVTPVPFDQRATDEGLDILLCNEPGFELLPAMDEGEDPTITIEYTKRFACPAQVNDAQFREAVVMKLAARLAKPLSRDAKDADRCLRNYQLALPKAQTQHANQSEPQRPVGGPPDWTTGR